MLVGFVCIFIGKFWVESFHEFVADRSVHRPFCWYLFVFPSFNPTSRLLKMLLATWGPLAWVVTSEIYPTHIRGKVRIAGSLCPIVALMPVLQAMSMSTASNWLLNFGIGYATPYLVNSGPGNVSRPHVESIKRPPASNICPIEAQRILTLLQAGLHTNVFWIWSGCCVLGFIFIFFSERPSHSDRNLC